MNKNDNDIVFAVRPKRIFMWSELFGEKKVANVFQIIVGIPGQVTYDHLCCLWRVVGSKRYLVILQTNQHQYTFTLLTQHNICLWWRRFDLGKEIVGHHGLVLINLGSTSISLSETVRREHHQTDSGSTVKKPATTIRARTDYTPHFFQFSSINGCIADPPVYRFCRYFVMFYTSTFFRS